MNHSSNHFCDGGLDARDIQPKCECGGADESEVIIHSTYLCAHTLIESPAKQFFTALSVLFQGDKYPWLMSLITDPFNPEESTFCVATLVASRYVVTAARCVQKRSPSSVYGWIDKDIQSKDPLQISMIFVHGDYNETSGYNDIALLKLTSVNMTAHPPACLAEPSDVEVLGGLVGQVYSHEAAREMNVTIDSTTVCSPGIICIIPGSECEVILLEKLITK